jgi:transposase
LDDKGQIIAEESLPNTRASLEQLSQRHSSATIAMETGTHSPWISRLFEARGHTVYVANARKVRAISQSITKSDEPDSRDDALMKRVD